ncbi:MAG: tRNA pseudouridine(38-40) synthase TruA [Vigna little leaf phytoplasma]|nr:tRNA pseudouridine(38-40) synthase TruA [Vigna little leaf phytoplasma]
MKKFIYKLIISYDGTNYHGYQKQPSPIITVQSIIEEVLYKITKQKIKTFAASRTDKGVHAKGQVIHFKSHFHITPIIIKKILNKILPFDIQIKKVELMPINFHARYSSKSKIYEYVFSKKPLNPFNSHFQVYFENLDWYKISQSLYLLEGCFDFTLFTNNKDKKKSPFKYIYKSTLKETKKNYVLIFHGKGFLKQMILFLVGFLILIGQQKKQITDLQKMLQLDKEQSKCLFIAPARGLCLKKILY